MKTRKSGRLGDIAEFKVMANDLDITNAVSTCNVWQDIFTSTWSASVVLSDTNNMIHTVPLKQGTKFEITIETKNDSKTDGKKTFKFVLFKITDRQLEKSQHQSYVCNLVHRDLFKNQQSRVQKYFSSPPGSIVSSAVSTSLGGSVDAESGGGSKSVMICNWSPFVVANWCAMWAKGDGADFCFFMSDEGKYKFKSMETMYKDDVGVKLIQRVGDIREQDASIPTDRFLTFSQFRFEHADAINNITGGYYGSELNSYNFIDKKWKKTPYTFGGADAGKAAFDGALFSNSKLTSISYVPEHPGMSDGANIYEDADGWSGSRKSSFMKLDGDKLYVQIPGGVKCWEWLGRGVEVELPSHEDMSDEELDKYYKGTYLVIAIAHQIEGELYQVTLELVKKRLSKGME